MSNGQVVIKDEYFLKNPVGSIQPTPRGVVLLFIYSHWMKCHLITENHYKQQQNYTR